MLYCAKSQQESLKGPASCDSVTCSKGHICSLKIHQCTWGKCNLFIHTILLT